MDEAGKDSASSGVDQFLLMFDTINGINDAPPSCSLQVLKNLNGVIKPGKLTLLLGPPGSGKSRYKLGVGDRDIKV